MSLRLLLLGLVAVLATGRAEAGARREGSRGGAAGQARTAVDEAEAPVGTDLESEATSEAVRRREADVERDPDDAEAHFQLGLVLCEHVHRVGLLDKLGVARRLREEFEVAVDLEPAHVGARIALIEFHRQAPPVAGGNPDEVRRHAEELLELEPVEGRLALARMLRKYGEARAAERHVRQVLGVDPTHRDALFLLARLAEDVGRLDEARVVLGALLRASPDDAEARLLLAGLAPATGGREPSPEAGGGAGWAAGCAPSDDASGSSGPE